MTRSRSRKLKRLQALKGRAVATSMPLAAALLATSPGALSQEQSNVVLENVIVTAQKRQEDLQEVPLSIQALGTAKIEELGISDFNDYVKYLPSVSYQTIAPGFAAVYMRGVASGGDGNHSGSLPSVGIYLDEQPITTIQGALDVHLYDIARVEALAGPQGTLYGASSQAGTLRIITNKPDPGKFAAGYDIEGNTVAEGGNGYTVEGFANLPISDTAAIRLVGWARKDAGYIDNVAGTRTFPSSGVTADNFDRAKDDYNDVETYGARVALRVDLGDNWTITPTVMAQNQKAEGSFGYDSTVGELDLTHMFPEDSDDTWVQAALTVEGRISNLDLVYSGSYLKRDVDTNSDYSDYSYFYDVLYGYGAYIMDDDGNLIDPSQYIQGKDRYNRQSHELRISTDSEKRVRFVGGLFMQRQEHDIEQRYLIQDLGADISVSGWEDTLWLTKQDRVDRDYAAFGELSFDITDKLTATGGLRYFKYENSLEGFFGFGAGFSGSTGEAACFDPNPFNGAPCKNLDKTTKDDGTIGKVNLSYRIDDDRMIYATWSRGFRPGGINRRGTLPPYKADYLTNYEIGWKTTWADNRVRFNGAIFQQEWEDFQFSLLGANGLTEIKNANQAEIRGIEADLSFAVTSGLTLSGGVAFLESELTESYCGFVDANNNPETDCPDPEAPKGTELPVTPEFKGNLTARYGFPIGSLEGHVQGSVVYSGERKSDLRVYEQSIIGSLPSYTIADFTAGVATENGMTFELFISNAFDERAELYRFAQCAEAVCGEEVYIVTNEPRTVGLRFGQRF
ncbi:outer membrane receptor protein involved in Fe transport [Povalibacter uvarum]|uniref:Outer membrane receptor protein involved in Fe transport n=1 Tax=Povalibacter uvarum TaxID=732238 RepID=A0A841HGB0_9GAMM|nr:TonB-dependent receptor [Povalibacter uvarum]MBB6092151.1 outer membrane receptor protein involved in Fe transport [Povalibacter uvarum]